MKRRAVRAGGRRRKVSAAPLLGFGVATMLLGVAAASRKREEPIEPGDDIEGDEPGRLEDGSRRIEPEIVEAEGATVESSVAG